MPSSHLKLAAERSSSASGERQRGLHRGSRDLRTELRLDAATSLKPNCARLCQPQITSTPRRVLPCRAVSQSRQEAVRRRRRRHRAAQSRGDSMVRPTSTGAKRRQEGGRCCCASSSSPCLRRGGSNCCSLTGPMKRKPAREAE